MGDEKLAFQAMNKEEKLAAVGDAEDIEDLDFMWEAWAERGYSETGQLYGAVLARKASLGYDLDEEEAARVAQIQAAAEAGAELPPVTGEMNG